MSKKDMNTLLEYREEIWKRTRQTSVKSETTKDTANALPLYMYYRNQFRDKNDLFNFESVNEEQPVTGLMPEVTLFLSRNHSLWIFHETLYHLENLSLQQRYIYWNKLESPEWVWFEKENQVKVWLQVINPTHITNIDDEIIVIDDLPSQIWNEEDHEIEEISERLDDRTYLSESDLADKCEIEIRSRHTRNIQPFAKYD